MAYAKAEGLKIQEIDILKTKLTGTQLVEIAGRQNMVLTDLVNQEHSAYTSHFEHHNFSTDYWTKMIQHNPEIMKQSIVIRGDKTMLVDTLSDIIKI